MLLYYITDRSQFAGDEQARRSRLLATIADAARCGVDYIQLREKDLSARELETLARDAVQALRSVNPQTKTVLLINSRTDIALACGAGGVHLRSHDISPSEVRSIWTQAGRAAPARAIIGVSCHTRAEVAHAAAEAADFAIFGPIFAKAQTRYAGLDALRDVCRENIPVLAVGGVTLENAASCLEAGAAGIAAIRLFQENDLEKVVRTCRHGY